MIPTRVYRLSERAITLAWPGEISLETSGLVMEADRTIRRQPFRGWIENVPAYHTLTVYYDPILLDIDLEQMLLDLGAKVNGNDNMLGRVIEVPVHYDPDKAPDLLHVTALLGLTVHELAELHSGEIYHVFMLGFMPGFPYMGVLPEKLVIPRKAIPAKKVSAGSVAIAAQQTGIYPFDSPGGWYVIGWTPLTMFENGRSLLEPGDKVKFIPQWA